jgi:hypothetical protein
LGGGVKIGLRYTFFLQKHGLTLLHSSLQLFKKQGEKPFGTIVLTWSRQKWKHDPGGSSDPVLYTGLILWTNHNITMMTSMRFTVLYFSIAKEGKYKV